MRIERLQVDEGFLDGLDLSFSEGLNVVIGARGSGKTSVIELIRFCLGVSAITEAQDASARAHALATLGTGRATVTVKVGDDSIRISRTADEPSTADLILPAVPLIVSQNEIEEIGLRSTSRLELLDRFVPEAVPAERSASRTVAIRSLTSQIASLRGEIDRLRVDLASLTVVPEQLQELSKQQSHWGELLNATKPQQEQLKQLTERITAARLRQTALDNAAEVLDLWANQLQATGLLDVELEAWPPGAGGEDWLQPARESVKELRSRVLDTAATATVMLRDVLALAARNRGESLGLDEQARELRKELESVQKGAGEIQRNIVLLQTQAARAAAAQASLSAKLDQLLKLTARRDETLDLLEGDRIAAFELRQAVVDSLNQLLSPQVRLSLEHQARLDNYTSAIATALRGSGMKYNIWAPKIASSLSPREFVRAIEDADVSTLVESVDRMTPDIAAKLLASVQAESVAAILTVQIEDDVEFSLLDGGDYKRSGQLSTGQRCTVVLPILLHQSEEPLIIDQPEDHLDNAFIVDTLVRGMEQQKSRIQIICSTHNANIPVLGNAEQIVLLSSDGTRAYVEHAAPLEHPVSVEAITRLMEGGIEAFERRASFYHESRK